MNAQETFYLNKLRCDIAIQQALSSWRPLPQFSGIECPRCQSRELVKRGLENGKQRYICRGCQRSFTEKPKIECNCLIPGNQPKCQDCPQFKQFLTLVKQKMNGLQGLGFHELQRLKFDLVDSATSPKNP